MLPPGRPADGARHPRGRGRGVGELGRRAAAPLHRLRLARRARGRATCCSPGWSTGSATRWRRSTPPPACSARPDGCCRCPSRPSTSPPGSAVSTRPRTVEVRGSGRRRDHPRAGSSRCGSCRTDPRPARRRSPRSTTPTSWSSGPGSLFTSMLPHLLVPEMAAGHRSRPPPAGCSCSTSPRSRGRPSGFAPETHLEVLAPARARRCASTWSSPTPRWCADAAALRDAAATAWRRGPAHAGCGPGRTPARPGPARRRVPCRLSDASTAPPDGSRKRSSLGGAQTARRRLPFRCGPLGCRPAPPRVSPPPA